MKIKALFCVIALFYSFAINAQHSKSDEADNGYLHYYRYSKAMNAARQFTCKKSDVKEEYIITFKDSGLFLKITRIDPKTKDSIRFTRLLNLLNEKDTAIFFLASLINPIRVHKVNYDSLLLSKPVSFVVNRERVTKYAKVHLKAFNENIEGSIIYMKGVPLEIYMHSRTQKYFFRLINYKL